MTPTEIHYTASGKETIKTVVTTDSCERRKSLQGDNCIDISFHDTEYIELPAGSYILFEDEKFSLIEDYRPRQEVSGIYTYNIRFSGIEEHFIKPILFRYVRNADNTIAFKEAEFSLYADLNEAGELIMETLKNVFPAPAYEWRKNCDLSKTERKVLSFSGQRLSDALSSIAREFETEWWIEKIPQTNLHILHFEKCEERGHFRLSRFDLSENGIPRSLASVDMQSQPERIPSRLYVYGSERNIVPPPNGSNSLYCKRLQLPDGTDYIDVPGSSSGIEEIKFFDEIYPRWTGHITALRIVEKNGQFQYYFKDDRLEYDENVHRIEGLNPRILFESGALRGREFEVTYNASHKEFYIEPVTEGNLLLPAPGFAPSEGNGTDLGDAYVLFNIRMPESYIQAAQNELREKAVEYAEKLARSYPPVNCTTHEVYWASKNLRPEIGATVEIYDTQFPSETDKLPCLVSRITAYSYKLTRPFNISFTVAESLAEGRFTTLENRISEQNGRIDSVWQDTRTISRRGWRDAEELAGMIDNLRSDLLLIGNPEGQFVTTFRFQANKNNDPNSLYISEGELHHVIYKRNDDPDNKYGIWQHTNYTLLNLPDSNRSYYLYARCNKNNSQCTIVPSLGQQPVEEDAGFYNFLLGTISSVFDNKRALNIVSGYTQIAGGSITTEKIQSPGGNLVIDLSKETPLIEAKGGAEIRGKIVLTSGDTYEKINEIKNELDTLPPIIGRNYLKLSDKIYYALTDYTRDKYTISLFNIGDNGKSFNVRYTNGLNEPGIYTFSVTVKNLSYYPIPVRIDITDQGSQTITIPASTSQRISCTAKAYLGYAGNYGVFCDFSVIGEMGGDVELSHPKLEKGSQMTEWIPAPEDLEEDTNRVIKEVDRITDDNIFSSSEKKQFLPEWENIKKEYETLTATATSYGIDYPPFKSKFTSLSDYLEPLLKNIQTDSPTDGETFIGKDFRTKLIEYYERRSLLCKNIDAQAGMLVNGLEIGGRNMIRNSGYFRSVTGWKAAGFNSNPILTETATIKATIGENFSSWAYLVNDTILNDLLIPGKTYTATGCLRANRSMQRYLQIITDTSSHVTISQGIRLSTSFQTFSVTFTYTTPSVDNLYMRIGQVGEDAWTIGDWLEIKYFKLEQGHKSTDWSPSPEDIDERFEESRYLLDTFAKGKTEIDGGLVLTRFLGVRGSDNETITGGLNGTRNQLPLIFAGASENQTAGNNNLIERAQNALFRVTGEGKLYALEGKISVFDMESFRLSDGSLGYRMVANTPQGQIEINPSSVINIQNTNSDMNVPMQSGLIELSQKQTIYFFTQPVEEYTVYDRGIEIPSGEVNLTGDLHLNLYINNIIIRATDRTSIEQGISKGFYANFKLKVNDPSGDKDYTEYLLTTPAHTATPYFEKFIGQVDPNQSVYCQYTIGINHIFHNIKLGKFRKKKEEGTIQLFFNSGTLNSSTAGIFNVDMSMARIQNGAIINLSAISPEKVTLRIENQRILFTYNGLQMSKSSGEYFYYRNKESKFDQSDPNYNLGFKGTIDPNSNIPYLVCGGSVNPDGNKRKSIGDLFYSGLVPNNTGMYKITLPDSMKNDENYIVQLTVSGEWGGNGIDNHANFISRDLPNNCFYIRTYNGTEPENAGFTFVVYKTN